MAADADTFLNLGEYAENITYGSATVKAVVDRAPVQPYEVDGLPVQTFTVTVALADVGTVTKGTDLVVLPQMLGGDNVTMRVVDIINNDDAMVTLVVIK